MVKNKTIKIKTGIPVILILFNLVFLTGCTELTDPFNAEDNSEGPYTVVFKITDLETGQPIVAARIAKILNNGNIDLFHTNAIGETAITEIVGTYEFIIDGGASTKSYDMIHQEVTINHNIQINVQLSTDESTLEIVEI